MYEDCANIEKIDFEIVSSILFGTKEIEDGVITSWLSLLCKQKFRTERDQHSSPWGELVHLVSIYMWPSVSIFFIHLSSDSLLWPCISFFYFTKSCLFPWRETTHTPDHIEAPPPIQILLSMAKTISASPREGPPVLPGPDNDWVAVSTSKAYSYYFLLLYFPSLRVVLSQERSC